jgi:hypothetical protein
MLEKLKKLFIESNLIFRVWFISVLMLFITVIYSREKLYGIIIGMPLSAIFLYIVFKAIGWLIDGLKQIEKNSIIERLAVMIIATVLFLGIYYLISPLQSCKRLELGGRFCIEHAKW